MTKVKPIVHSLAIAFGGLASCMLIAPASAQTTPAAPAPQAQLKERVEVTGTLIRRIEGETALPVVTLKADELEKAGVTNAEGAVKFITQNQSGTVTSGSVSATNGAAAYADLRSLGSSRTLTLFNGQRVAPNPFAVVGTDLNTLPSVALERIETLADGASATYGTDAIAGVVNFITRREYQGITVAGEIQYPQGAGGEVYTASVLGGYGNLNTQGWNVYGGFNFRRQQPMSGVERGFMDSSLIPEHGFNGTSPTTFPANWSQSPGVASTNPGLPGCFPPSSISVPSSLLGNSIQCFADTQLWTNVIPEQEQWSAILKGSLALGANATASLEYFWSQNRVQSQIAPSPEGGLSMTPASPFYPGNGITPTATGLNPANPVSIGWRTTVLGPRMGEQTNDTQRLLANIQGTAYDWDYTASALWSNAEVTNEFLNGWPKTQTLRDGVSGTTCAVPRTGAVNGVGGTCPAGQTIPTGVYLNPFGNQTPAGLAYMQANTVLGEVQNGESTTYGLNAVASRQFGNLAGGPMSLALGAEWRSEEMVYNTNVALVGQAASSGLAGSGAVREGDRHIWAVAAEMNFPILKNLDLGVAVRYDDYSDVGGTTNPKVSLRYQPIEQVLLRASYNTGFAAPSLYTLYLPNSTTFTANRYNDPTLCPNGVPNTAAGAVVSRDCGIQFQQLQGGNANLEPETSEAYTIGFVLQPTPQISFGLDYWNYHIEDSISVIGEQSIFADPNKYANLFVRCSQAGARAQAIGACQIPGGDPLAYVVNTFLNLGDVKTSGIDGQFNWTGGATEFGRFSVGLRGTYVLKYEFQTEPGGQFFDPLGNYSPQFGGPVIRYQQVTNLGWQYTTWTVNLFNQFQTGYTDQNGAANVAPGFRNNTVGKNSVWNLSTTYSGFKGLTIAAGILNVLNTDPPYSNQAGRFQARGYDDRFASPLGRVYTLGARYQFM